MPDAVIVQHVRFEGPGRIRPWLDDAGYHVQTVRLDLGDALPDPWAVDFVVIMGGPMSVHDTAVHPWLAAERAFVGQCLARGTRLLGVCLGAQIIAAAAGVRVYRHSEPEIGWFPIEAVPLPGDVEALAFPPRAHVFHWHGETFDLPPGAIHLATSAVCRHQAFQLGRAVIGLQFHVETTPSLLEGLVEHAAADLVSAPHVQSAGALLATPPEHYAAIEPLLDAVLTFLHTAPAASGPC